MRKLFTIMAVLTVVFSFAQKKPNINKAKAAMDKGDYSFAKSEVDRAIEDEKAKTKAKTWFYRGMIYMSLDTAGVEPGEYKTALESFDKTIELDPEQKQSGNYPGFATDIQALSTGLGYVDYAKNNYYTYYYNNGIENYNAEEYAEASKNFETAYYLNNADTNAILNSAYSAALADDHETAKANFQKSLDAGLKDKNIFLQLYNYSVQAEDYEKALDIIGKAREVYPSDPDMAKYQIGLLIQLDKVDDAMVQAKEAIANNPENPELYFSYGTLLEETGNPEEAEKQYRKALEIDPDHFSSTFNLGVLIFNRSQELIKERNGLNYNEDKKIEELSSQIDVELKKALPVWEKLYQLNSTDSTVLETLGYIYTNLKMNDKAEKIQNELDGL